MTRSPPGWQPSAELSVLATRASLYQTLRQFFLDRDVLEVETPILGAAATVDPFIDSLHTQVAGECRYLQTSPEFFLKRLVAAYRRDVYALGKVFRQGEQGRRHHPEFTLLEWYRIGWDEQQLMEEVYGLLRALLPGLEMSQFSYREVFLRYLSIDPHQASLEALSQLARSSVALAGESDDRNFWLDLLMTHCIEPQLPPHLVFIYDYPQSQAALATLGQNPQGQVIARRFEVYLNGMELANGYFELTDAAEQQRRFEQDQHYRALKHLPELPYDQQLVAALQHGLPPCAGVALGIDRLLMHLCKLDAIEQVLSFP